ncbi:MAG: hypothetical protein U5K79_08405 [Cyclobacteriaceae bacterium]|nr:hypothetical protein [Cyclobacteriaceae bacterium]
MKKFLKITGFTIILFFAAVIAWIFANHERPAHPGYKAEILNITSGASFGSKWQGIWSG